jgi:hypothetical protein
VLKNQLKATFFPIKSTKSDYFRLKNQLKKVDYFGQKNKLKRPALATIDQLGSFTSTDFCSGETLFTDLLENAKYIQIRGQNRYT